MASRHWFRRTAPAVPPRAGRRAPTAPPPAAPSASYRSALRTPGAAAFFLAAAPARVGVAMTGLGLVWLVHTETGSFGAAGLVTGAFAVAEALVGPLVARLMDRYGQGRVLVPLLTAHAGALMALVALALAGAPTMPLTVAGLGAGATIPQVGALSSARWSALLHGRAELAPAFALEAFANEAAYLLGPALAVLAATRLHPAAGTVLAGVLVVGAGLALAAQRRTAPKPGPRPVPAAAPGPAPDRTAVPGTGARTLLSRHFAALLVVNLALGVFFGSTQVSLSAFADDHHAAPAAGLLYGVMGAASLLAGLAYGRYGRRTPPGSQLPLILALLGCASLLPLLAATPWQLGLALLLPGAGVAPCVIASARLVESVMPRAVLTQSFTWANSASAAGIALAAAAVGRLVDGPGGAGAGFAVPFVALTVAAALTWSDVTLRPRSYGPPRPRPSTPRASRPARPARGPDPGGPSR
ncbi:MFS transporter [Streptomyces sp. NBC_00102]|uniref:MFS transporter n=1 Tax=Streptomyces sp. NBC_00102 TaxID=2975652 RepID=UPI0022519E6F|nr:MFS transporter [Streptomyces sp. NBC_00102]MCX5399523.1 MFS transporter [Streptomyces sp. NBC_00102]